MRRRLIIALACALAVVLGGVGLVYARQESLLFAPEPLAADHVFAWPQVEEVRIPVDGASLSALHLKLPDPKGVVFFLHGNAGNLASWFVNVDFYRRADFDLFMIDYRGYGKSTGSIRSEAQLRADVDAAWQLIAARYEGRRKVIYGRSLGTALAAGLAARVRPDLTVLVSPYWSMTELARLHYPHLPVWLLRYTLSTFEDLARIDGPVLLMHGDRDPLIPIGHSERLQAVARSARLVRIEGAAHNDIQDFDQYRALLAAELAKL
jgi:pimeloyl-ACP methyl ester carboxylesterase